MAQIQENEACPADVSHAIPANSTNISSGDVVCMATRDPLSRTILGTTPGRIVPISAEFHAQYLHGVSDAKWDTNIGGAVDYAAPSTDNEIAVKRSGMFYLAIVDTEGNKGDYVRYDSGGTGVQLFDIDNQVPGFAVARIARDFDGATANDVQLCELITIPVGGPNLYYWLENRVIDGCQILAQSTATSSSVNIAVGATADAENLFIIQNQVFSAASDRTLNIGICSVAGASTFAAKYIVARSGGFAARTCSGVHSAFATYSVLGISVGMMVPAAFTAGEIPIGIALRFSVQSYTNGLLFPLLGPGRLPRFGSWAL